MGTGIIIGMASLTVASCIVQKIFQPRSKLFDFVIESCLVVTAIGIMAKVINLLGKL